MRMSETKKLIPHGWDSQPIGALVTEQLKSTIKVSEASGFGAYPFFTSGDDILVHSQPLIDGKTIFLATGGQANVKYYDGDAAYSTDTYALKSNGQIAAKLLFYDLDTMASYIDGHYFQGSGLKHLQKKDLKRHELCFPKDMGEQQRIVRLLTCLDEAIAKTEALIEKYRRIKQGMMHDLLTYGIDKEGNIRSPKTHRFKPSPLGMIPEEWKCVNITHFTESNANAIKTGPFGSMLKKEQYTREGYKVYGQQQVISGDKDFGGYYIDDLLYRSLMAYSVQSGDILISCMGTIGNVLVINDNYQPGIINPRLMKFSIDTSCNDVNFIAYLLESETTQRQLENMSVGGTMPSINKGIILCLYFVSLSIKEQRIIVNRIKDVERLINGEEMYLSKIRCIRQGLLHDLLTGKVRIPETVNI